MGALISQHGEKRSAQQKEIEGIDLTADGLHPQLHECGKEKRTQDRTGQSHARPVENHEQDQSCTGLGKARHKVHPEGDAATGQQTDRSSHERIEAVACGMGNAEGGGRRGELRSVSPPHCGQKRPQVKAHGKEKHKEQDSGSAEDGQREREQKAAENLSAKAKKVREFLKNNEDRIGTQGKAVKSNITDNESAKMPSSHGVIQGYNVIATVDEKHQIIVDAQAFGDGHEARHVKQVIDSLHTTFRRLDSRLDIYKEAVVTADSGFHSEAAARSVLGRGIDAYIADTHFRKRDPRFASQPTHKGKSTDKLHTRRKRKYFSSAEFHVTVEGALICPAGKEMKSKCPNYRDKKNGYTGQTFMGHPEYCAGCDLRSRCIRNPSTPARQVTKITGGMPHNTHSSAVAQMIERFDSERGRHYYSRRMGTVEPVALIFLQMVKPSIPGSIMSRRIKSKLPRWYSSKAC